MILQGKIHSTGSIQGQIQETYNLVGLFDKATIVAYTGAYTVTPSTEVQILPTTYKTPTRNIVVEAIPSYYGLITYDGTVITVS